MGKRHSERHLGKRGGWLRAAVLGANDGLVSTASLMVGVASAGILSMGGADHVLVSGFAGLVAGAMSMAAGEYVSVSSQADGERADLARERYELAVSPQMELAELAGIYEARGLDPALAQQVAEQLTRHDAMDAHARDELGLTEVMAARPLSAALASAGSFAVGSALPLLTAYLAAGSRVIPAIFAVSLLGLAGMGALAANAAGASPVRGAARVTFWGLLAMVLTAGAGLLFGAIS
jgi:VIT1/CCC1 family predicted Fe2+/Mn2+ transporter